MAGKRRALIIANSEYQDSGLKRLRAPAKDAEELTSVLGASDIGGFAINQLLDKPEATLRREILHFFDGASMEDLLLLHISCHGMKNDYGDLFFCAFDTELEALDATAVSSDYVKQQMGRSRSRSIVLILDCCFSGSFPSGLSSHRAGGSIDLEERFEGRGRAILTASTSMEYSFEGTDMSEDKNQPSVFTSAVVHGLRTGEADMDRDGFISVNELHEYARDKIREHTTKQRPQAWFFGLEGPLHIARSKRAARRIPPSMAFTNMALTASPMAGLPSDVTHQLDLLGASDLSGRGAVAGRIKVLLGRLSYGQEAMEAAISKTSDFGSQKLDTHFNDARNKLERIRHSSDDRSTAGQIFEVEDIFDGIMKELNRITLRERRGSSLEENYFLARSLKELFYQMREDLYDLENETRSEKTPMDYLWRHLSVLEGRLNEVLDLYFTTIQGVLLQNSGLDSGFDNMVDALLHELRSVTTRIRPTRLTARRYEHNSVTGILNTSFPDYSVWSISQIIHELGHLVMAELPSDVMNILASSLAIRDFRSVMDELFCDSFATFVMGPSYPCSYILLYAQPLDTSNPEQISSTFSRFPSTLIRVRMCALMLQLSRHAEKQQTNEMLETFTRALGAYIDEFHQELPLKQQRYPTELDRMADAFHKLLIDELPNAAADLSTMGQERVSHLAEQLKHESKADIATDTTIRDILNAGWLARLQGTADPGVQVRETIQYLIAAQTRAVMSGRSRPRRLQG